MNDDQLMITVNLIGGLLYKLVNQQIAEDELAGLHNWAFASKDNQALFEDILNEEGLGEALNFVLEIDKAGALKEVLGKIAVMNWVQLPGAMR
jgi:hypothetical protein